MIENTKKLKKRKKIEEKDKPFVKPKKKDKYDIGNEEIIEPTLDNYRNLQEEIKKLKLLKLKQEANGRKKI